MSDLETLYRLTDHIARKDHRFYVKGPGKADRATNRFIERVGVEARARLGSRVRSEEPVTDGTDLRFAFYLPKERTAVEIALGLGNPASEWEKDLFKALLARHHGKGIRKLVFFTLPKGVKVRNSPSSREEIRYLKARGIEVKIRQLRGRRDLNLDHSTP
jgi:hypothetical protein